MINDPLFHRLLELSWRGKLSPAQEAELRGWLASHPEAQAEWEAESGLSEVLRQLPDAAVPSNFTSLVLQSVERESKAAVRVPVARWKLRWWLPKAAAASLVVAAGIFTYHHGVVTARREYAQSVEAVSDVSSLPSPEVLQNFDAIRTLNQTPPADRQLLSLLE